MPPNRKRFTHAALMGDVVGSEAATSPKQFHKLFNQVITEANETSQSSIASPLTITLGDEFQGLCPTLGQGAALMRRLRLKLLTKGINCRFALGLVNIQTSVSENAAWNMIGPGLAAVRERLESKDKHTAYGFRLPSECATAEMLEAIGASLTEIERSWTDRQLELIAIAELQDIDSESAARKMRIAPRVYYKIRAAARLELHQRLWNAVFSAMAPLDKKHLAR